MNFRDKIILGRTGLKVSRLGIGSGYGLPAKAIERAYREFDINYFFWSSPRRKTVQEAVNNIAPKDREKIVIAIQTYDHIGSFMTHFVEKGLSELKIDYADILILGWFNSIPSHKILDTALKLKERDLIKFIGMSGHNRPAFGKIAQQPDLPIDVFMTRYNAIHRGAEKDIFPYLTAKNRPGIISYTATSWGQLLKPGKLPKGELPLTSSDCYRFCLSNPNVNLCLTGPKNEKELEDAVIALDKGPLSDEEMARIKRIGDHLK